MTKSSECVRRWCPGTRTRRRSYIDEVGVTERLHRRGIGARMMQEMFDWGRELGCAEAWVGTELDNDPARALYQSFEPSVEDPFAYYLYKLD